MNRLPGNMLLLIGSNDDNRQLALKIIASDHFDHFISIHPRHHVVEEDQVRVILIQTFQCLVAILITEEFIIHPFKVVFYQAQIEGFIINHEYFSVRGNLL